MLECLKLTNFRCFENHSIRFRPLNIVVGLNNAGKTTVAEALRILSVAAVRFPHRPFKDPPSWASIPRHLTGCSFSLENLQIQFETLFHRYGDPPAMVEGDFGKRGRVRVYIGREGQVHCVIYNGSGTLAKSQAKARTIKIPTLATLPQVAPVSPEERILLPDYVRTSLSSRLAPIHFRNQLNLLYDRFSDFQDNVQTTWPGLRVEELIGQGGQPGERLDLEIRDGDFVGEVALMGHGLQMWLQTVWFLTRSHGYATVVLDEPDVYMHADLQRKLIRYVRNLFPQVIVTTHSTEIMAEVPPDSIIVVDRTKRESRYADTLPAVQRVMSAMGSAHNVHLARLWSAKRFLLVEGDDVTLLQHFQNKLFPNTLDPIGAFPRASFGGWGGWRLALGSSFVLQNAAGTEIRTYCLLDSDYHCPGQIEEVRQQFGSRGVDVHIWERKELENYLLEPAAISRAAAARMTSKGFPDTASVAARLGSIAARTMERVFDGFGQEFLAWKRSLGLPGANKMAREYMAEKTARVGAVGLVSGKALLSEIFTWIQEEFGISPTPTFVARHIDHGELADEVKSVMTAIERGQALIPQDWPAAGATDAGDGIS